MRKKIIVHGCGAIALALMANGVMAQEIGVVEKVKEAQVGSSIADAVGGVASVGTPKISNVGADGGMGASDSLRQSAKQDRAQPLPSLKDSDFQKFVSEATGKALPIFGADFFAGASSIFAPLQSTPVPSDYTLGAGDELTVRGWGTAEINYRAVIDRNGLIAIPTIGTIPLAGVKAGDAESVIRTAIGRFYKGVNVNVSFGQLRAITVYVVGQARRPGSYTVSGYSTLVTALFASGGANSNGSLRRVQVKRDGKVVRELDLYNFIAKGDKSADIRLHDGDTIYIPVASGFVAMTGNVNTPAIYELRSESDSVRSILEIAGGLPVVADPRRASIERIDSSKAQPRSISEFALDDVGMKTTLKNGDLISVHSITPEFENAVTLRGNVDHPFRMPFKAGMKVADLIPNRAFLMNRASLKRQNDTVLASSQSEEVTKALSNNVSDLAQRIGGLIDEVNWDYAVVERVEKSTMSVSLVTFNLGRALDEPSSEDNVQLQAGDTVTIFSQNDIRVPLAKRMVFVRIEGEVNRPGVYQMRSGETLKDVVTKAGGLTDDAYLFGSEFYREQVRQEQQKNLAKAIRRLEAIVASEQGKDLSFTDATGAQAALAKSQLQASAGREALRRMRELSPTGRIALDLNPNKHSSAEFPHLKLENGDRLVVPSKPDFVHIYGAVSQEASLLWKPGMTAAKYLEMAAPLHEADTDAIFVVRADGSVISNFSSTWFSKISNVEIMPGDSIVVPEKISRETAYTRFITGLKDWTQILSSFGLTAAAIKTLRQ